MKCIYKLFTRHVLAINILNKVNKRIIFSPLKQVNPDYFSSEI